MEKTNIYFLLDKSANAVKIGRSKNPTMRKEQLQTGNASKLKLLYVIENVQENMEKHIHGVCQRYHVQGEWFDKSVLEHLLLKHEYYKNNMKKI